MTKAKKDRLGRGLGALLGDYFEQEPKAEDSSRVSVDAIVANPLQPRRDFPEEELTDLASSIRENGLLQPLLVRPAPTAPGRYELVAGERRLRAVRSLGWADVPVVVREVDDETLLVLALVENLQREALSPLDEAEGYRTLQEQFGLTQDEISRSVGKDRSTVANFLRLLKLPPSIRKFLGEGRLSMGHARALLAVEDPIRAGELARRAVAEGWSVREVERRAAGSRDGSGTKRKAAKERSGRDPIVRALEEAL
ncbi:MAG TPA: ParB/RepB/Spo0J family partition protein, partial [Longimicrobiales bacterium]